MAWFCFISSTLPVITVIPLTLVFIGKDGKHFSESTTKMSSEEEKVIDPEVLSEAPSEQSAENEFDPLLNNQQQQQRFATSSSINAEEEELPPPMTVFYGAPESKRKAYKSNFLSCCGEVYSFIEPFCHKDFFIVFVSSFFSISGLSFISGFLLYFIKDLVHPNYSIFGGIVSTPEQAQGVYQALVSFTAFFTSSISGFISDYIPHGRKVMLSLGGVSCCLAIVSIFTTLRFEFILLGAYVVKIMLLVD